MKLFLAGLFALTLQTFAAFGSEVAPELEQAVRLKAAEVLHDPYSAVFTFDVITEMGDGIAGKICGTVNAKNGFGAFTGQQFFYAGYIKLGEDYTVIAFSVPGYSLQQALAYGTICR